MAGLIDPPKTTDPLELLEYFQDIRDAELNKKSNDTGIFTKEDEDSSGIMQFFSDWWNDTERKVEEAREELRISLQDMPMPEMPTVDMTTDALPTITPESEPIIETVADKPIDPDSLIKEIMSNQSAIRSSKGLMAPSVDKEIINESVSDVVSDTPAVEVQPDTNGKVNDLLNFIGKGEGGYESSHSGTIGGKIQNSTSATTRDGKKLTELTVGEIKEYMDLSIEDKDRLFAVGKFQFIPKTFDLVVEKMNLSDDKVFTSDLQEKMGTYLLTDKVGRKLQTWLYQDDTTIKKSNVNDAMLALAKEFASVPVPFNIPKNPNPTSKNPWPKVDLKAGDSYYSEGISGGNSAQHTIEETKDILNKVKGSLKMLGQVSESPRPRRKPAGAMERPPL